MSGLLKAKQKHKYKINVTQRNRAGRGAAKLATAAFIVNESQHEQSATTSAAGAILEAQEAASWTVQSMDVDVALTQHCWKMSLADGTAVCSYSVYDMFMHSYGVSCIVHDVLFIRPSVYSGVHKS